MEKQRTGFTVVELLVYIAILTMAIGAVITLILAGTEIVGRLKVMQDVRESGMVSLERMSREIQRSHDIIETSSTFGSSPGSITLLADNEADEEYETEFTVENGELVVYKDGVLQGSLVTDTVEVDSLEFEHVTHGVTESVKIELILSSRDADPERIDSFYTSALLRGSY